MYLVPFPSHYSLSVKETSVTATKLNPLLSRLLEPQGFLLEKSVLIFHRKLLLEIGEVGRVHTLKRPLDPQEPRLQSPLIAKHIAKLLFIELDGLLSNIVKSHHNIPIVLLPSLADHCVVVRMPTPSGKKAKRSSVPGCNHVAATEEERVMI